MRGRAKLERTRTTGTRPYLLRGLVVCGICTRRMQGSTIRKVITYYRCHARTLAPGSAVLSDHPRTVNLREDVLLDPLNDWIWRLFDRANVDRTVAALIGSQEGPRDVDARSVTEKRLADAETRLRRFQAAIEAGVDPTALVEVINEAQEQRAAVRAQLEGLPPPNLMTAAEAYARIDSLGDVGKTVKQGSPENLSRLYRLCIFS
jgi:hypothetical protein